MKTSDPTLDSIAKVLIRCFWMVMALLMAWFLFYLTGGDWAYGFHREIWFDLTRHEFALLNLYGLTFLKLSAFGLFLVPYIAIRMVLRQTSPDEGAPRS